jgi:ferritin
MITKRLQEELNKQLNKELYSAYLYLSMAGWLSSANLPGFSHWMLMQFEEEQAHAMKFFQYIIDRGGQVELKDIKKPKSEWKDIIDVFQDVVKHEVSVTNSINDLVDVAMDERDHATVNMLQWYVSEQVEEEATVGDLLQQLKLVEGRGAGLFMLDREAGQRTNTLTDNNA